MILSSVWLYTAFYIRVNDNILLLRYKEKISILSYVGNPNKNTQYLFNGSWIGSKLFIRLFILLTYE
jgi:hypothetical protein